MPSQNIKLLSPSHSNRDVLDMPPDQEKISALMDGELPKSALAATLASAYQGKGREQWETYHFVGDALRSNGLIEGQMQTSQDFMSRLSQTLDKEPHHLPIQAKAAGSMIWLRKALPSVALAASVAAVSWVVVPQLRTNSDTVTVAMQSSERSGVLSEREGPVSVSLSKADNYLVADTGNTMIRDAKLDSYLQAHNQYAPHVAAPNIRVVSNDQAVCGTTC